MRRTAGFDELERPVEARSKKARAALDVRGQAALISGKNRNDERIRFLQIVHGSLLELAMDIGRNPQRRHGDHREGHRKQ